MTSSTPSTPLVPARDWRTYNQAQTTEAAVFEDYLFALLSPVPEPDYAGNGRPRHSLRDLLFIAIHQAYTGLSTRRHQGHLQRLHDADYITAIPHFNATSWLLNDEHTGEILRALVQDSARPLAGIEQDFAIDSTGFACGTYGSYLETRYRTRDGRRSDESKRREYVKLHAATGVLTNIITDAVVTNHRGADTTQFKDLLHGTAQGFLVREVSADKAYSSKANHWHVHQLGGQALIPFKSGYNAPDGRIRGGTQRGIAGLPGSAKIWRRAFHYFQAFEEEFNARYHKRSNVEATFSALKRRFGERLRSRNEVARFNEVLVRVVAYNVTVLVEAVMEYGLEPGFWGSLHGNPHSHDT